VVQASAEKATMVAAVRLVQPRAAAVVAQVAQVQTAQATLVALAGRHQQTRSQAQALVTLAAAVVVATRLAERRGLMREMAEVRRLAQMRLRIVAGVAAVRQVRTMAGTAHRVASSYAGLLQTQQDLPSASQEQRQTEPMVLTHGTHGIQLAHWYWHNRKGWLWHTSHNSMTTTRFPR
jgi:hypothetical protein